MRFKSPLSLKATNRKSLSMNREYWQELITVYINLHHNLSQRKAINSQNESHKQRFKALFLGMSIDVTRRLRNLEVSIKLHVTENRGEPHFSAVFSLKFIPGNNERNLQSRREQSSCCLPLDFICHVSSVAARHIVIDYSNAALSIIDLRWESQRVTE